MKISFFTDNDVPDSIGNYLIARGHSVTRLREVIPIDSPDPYVAASCNAADMVLVSFNHKDFEKIIRSSNQIVINGNQPTKRSIKQLRRLSMNCDHHMGLDSVKMYIDLIESELSIPDRDFPAHVFVGRTHCRIYRGVL